MTTIILPNTPDAAHLEEVKADMQRLGAPVIRCAWYEGGELIVALEGSHRLVAAQALGIVPVLHLLGDDEMITCDEIGYDDMGWFDGEPARVADIRERMGRPNATYAGSPMITFETVEITEAA